MNQRRGENAYTIVSTLKKTEKHHIYLAKNYFTGQQVVIKTLDSRHKGDSGLIQELRHETQISRQLRHPNIRNVEGLFEEDANVYMVADYIAGKSLQDILAERPVNIGSEQAMKWIQQILEALDYALGLGIMHLNLDPSHVIISESDDAVLTGFGTRVESSFADAGVCATCHPVLFQSPEVFYGDSVSASSDVFSMGVLAYVLVCDKLPWNIDPKIMPLLQKQQSMVRPVIDPELLGRKMPHWLFTILNKAMLPDPSRRFASATEMLNALRAGLVVPYEPYRAYPARVEKVLEPVLPPEPEIVLEPIPAPQPPVMEASPPPPKRDWSALDPVGTVTTPKPVIPKPDKPVNTQRPAVSQEVIDPKIKRLFLRLMLASLLICLYAVAKYVVFSEKPAFTHLEEMKEEELLDAPVAVDNKAIKMVYVEGDSTIIGSVSPDAADDEFPPVKLKLTGFYISPHEITNEQWSMVYPDYFYDRKDKDLPVVNVSFMDVLEYCNAKSRLDKLEPCYSYSDGYYCDFNANGYRLPTEAEWEFAAKARVKVNYTKYSGSNTPDAVGWHKGNSDGRLHPVGDKDANALKLYDMSGNAGEWVWNWYARYSHSLDRYAGATAGTEKVVRGGSWDKEAVNMRVTARGHSKPWVQSPSIGFRVVRSK